MGSFSISFAPRGLSNPKVTLVLPGKDPKIEPKVRYYQPPVRTVNILALKKYLALKKIFLSLIVIIFGTIDKIVLFLWVFATGMGDS